LQLALCPRQPTVSVGMPGRFRSLNRYSELQGSGAN